MTEVNESYTVSKLIEQLKDCPPSYRVLVCADSVAPPSPWAEEFRVECDVRLKVVRISGDLT